MALSVVQQGFYFLAVPEAVAYIPPPSETIAKEVSRRSRIVTRGLTAIWKNRILFIKKSTFWYGACLFIHKVIRRLIPFLLLTIFLANLILAFYSYLWGLLLLCQIVCYIISILAFYKIFNNYLASFFAYFMAFNMGTGIGVYQFLTSKGRSKW